METRIYQSKNGAIAALAAAGALAPSRRARHMSRFPHLEQRTPQVLVGLANERLHLTLTDRTKTDR